jgi:hypothetical protein
VTTVIHPVFYVAPNTFKTSFHSPTSGRYSNLWYLITVLTTRACHLVHNLETDIVSRYPEVETRCCDSRVRYRHKDELILGYGMIRHLWITPRLVNIHWHILFWCSTLIDESDPDHITWMPQMTGLRRCQGLDWRSSFSGDMEPFSRATCSAKLTIIVVDEDYISFHQLRGSLRPRYVSTANTILTAR